MSKGYSEYETDASQVRNSPSWLSSGERDSDFLRSVEGASANDMPTDPQAIFCEFYKQYLKDVRALKTFPAIHGSFKECSQIFEAFIRKRLPLSLEKMKDRTPAFCLIPLGAILDKKPTAAQKERFSQQWSKLEKTLLPKNYAMTASITHTSHDEFPVVFMILIGKF